MPNSMDKPPGRADSRASEPDPVRYLLRLFVSGMTPRSTDAIARVKAICEEYLSGQYDLEVIDIYQQPGVARVEQIVATPTLIKKVPAPLRRLVGDLSDKRRVLLGLNIKEKCKTLADSSSD